ncbi:D-isomer specific 2-hydroxyacid dehydrogenase NAD-binding protein [Desulfovibrio sp. X2]|uniref:phosphoglycerate dehydrogenase n=1 Tax=Desulfovibrio sp. X2 TaxID=941449 RepID=UPI000358E341|nr:phosphoglycerate dehydrogenase [Desulfovibrio sp. X2]EPR44079.1 D-isomer specific 2-hydroxyacid dehydrogenase NAD-binding protein [Desulfovibrio sp. X2]
MRIAITTSSFAVYGRAPLELLERAGAEIVLNPHGRKLTPEETVALCADCEGILAGTESLSCDVLAKLPRLKAISRCGVGMDSVDQTACAAQGITVRNTPFGPTRSVAELTVGLILDLLRQVTRMDREMRGGVWKKRMGNLLLGKRVGIIGFGRIGQATGELLSALGAEIAYADPCVECVLGERMEIDSLLAWADIVSLHCSKPGDACYLIDAERLRLMRPGTWLVNAGRGGLVDEEALHALLASGHLAGAAMDCFSAEPYKGPLAELDNIIITPHIGSYAKEGRSRMEFDAAKNLLEALGVPVPPEVRP